MADEPNNGFFKELVLGEIKSLRDVVSRNYDEHKVIMNAIAAVDKRLAVIEERLCGQTTVRSAGITGRATVVATAITALGALVVAVLAIILK